MRPPHADQSVAFHKSLKRRASLHLQTHYTREMALDSSSVIIEEALANWQTMRLKSPVSARHSSFPFPLTPTFVCLNIVLQHSMSSVRNICEYNEISFVKLTGILMKRGKLRLHKYLCVTKVFVMKSPATKLAVTWNWQTAAKLTVLSMYNHGMYSTFQ